MKIIYFSTSTDILKEWKEKIKSHTIIECYDMDSLNEEIQNSSPYMIIADFDTVSIEINKMFSANNVLEKLMVLEKVPLIATGRMLISHGVRAYGNARMSQVHFTQMIDTVMKNNIWTYPELTASLLKNSQINHLPQESIDMIETRLSLKEKEVLFCVLDALTNNAIASKLSITTRTVKAHVHSIFTKLHVNDRVGLILLLK